MPSIAIDDDSRQYNFDSNIMTTATATYDHASTMRSIFATMEDILSNDNANEDGNDLPLGIQLLDSMATTTNNNNDDDDISNSIYHHNLLQSSLQITTSLHSRIDYETSQLESESRELSSKLQSVTSLENQLDALTKEREGMVERKKMLQHSMDVCHQAMAAMTTMSSSENAAAAAATTKKKMIPKIGKEVSLHALMTNIRWDYDRSTATAVDENSVTGSSNNDNSTILAGEIFHPTTQKVKKFSINKAKCNNNDEYEIAESLWKLMEG